MNTFLDDLFEHRSEDIQSKDPKIEALEELDKWSQDFWRVDPEKLKIQFAQQGYEDKGHGHIEQIISNVGELLENYFEVLSQLNEFPGNEKKKLKEGFKLNLILFYAAVHLHDIGMRFPGIFKALSGYVDGKGRNPLHIGEIIHNYHHYASFIILMEMSRPEAIDIDDIKEKPYLSNIRGIKEINTAVDNINKLNAKLKGIHYSYFRKFFKDFGEFKILLAILCLLHKEVNIDYVNNITRKFKDGKTGTINIFNKWWSYFERAQAWTDKMYQRFSRDGTVNLPACSDHELLMQNDETDRMPGILDPALVEALLQYGDKTEITIARLARIPIGYKQESFSESPLKDFRNDTKYDNQEGYICTNIAQRVISDFARARACRFITVPLITVEKIKKEQSKETKPELNIVIHYLRFDGDDDVFRWIRFHNEKDFFDLGFLRAIRFHIPVIIHLLENEDKASKQYKKNPVFALTFKKEDHSIMNEGDLKNLFCIFPTNPGKDSFPDTKKGLILLRYTRNKDKENGINSRQSFPYTRENRMIIDKYSQLLIKHKEKDSQKVFHETCDMTVPASFEIMAVLNLFTEEEA